MADEQLSVRFIGDASSLEAASKQSTAALDNVTKSVQAADLTWKEFVGQRMGSYMKEFGGHGPAIKQIAKEWNDYKASLAGVSNATAKVSQSLQQSSAAIARNAAVMGGSIRKGSNEATMSMVNLGRVLQDAPYGFIGIANNLNPLLESFQRLRKETGSVSGVMKALGTSLIGGGGLGLALSAVTAVMQFASVGLSMWTRGMGKAAEQEDELAKKTEETRKRIAELTKSFADVKVDIKAEAVGSTQGEIEKVRALANVVQDQTKSYNQRNNALKELQGINKNYFGDLTLEAGSLKTLTEKVNEYSNAIISAAIVKEFSSDIAKVSKEIVTQRHEIDKGVQSISDLSLALKLAKERNTDLKSKELGYTTSEISSAQNRFGKAVGLVKEQTAALSKLGEQKVLLTKGLNDALGEALKFKPLTDDKTGSGNKKDNNFSFLFDFLPFDPSGKLKPEQRGKLLDAADRFSKEFTGIFKGMDFATKAKTEDEKVKLALQFDADLKAGNVKFDLTKIREATEKAIKDADVIPESTIGEIDKTVVDKFIRGFQDAQETLKSKSFDFSIPVNIGTDLASQVELFKTKVKQLGGEIPKTIEGKDIFGKPVELKFEDLFDTSKIANNDALEALKKALEIIYGKTITLQDQFVQAVNDAFANLKIDAFTGLGEAIGQAIASGGNTFENAARSFAGMIGDFIELMGKDMIKLGVAKIGIDKALAALAASFASMPGVALVAIGAATVAIGALVKSSFANTKPKGFAAGGLAFGPTLGLVGEGIGTSRSNPEVIAPLDKLKQFINPNSGSIAMPMGDWKIRGKDLVFVMAQTQKSQRRAT